MLKRLKKYIPLIAIIGIFIVLCSLVINRAIWFDESSSAQMIKGDFCEIAEMTALDVHPPLYYWLLRIWSLAFGRSLIALRSFSVFCAIIALVFAFMTFKRWSKSYKIANFLTLALALCPFFVYYATEIRMYGLVCAIVMASIYVLDLALEKNSRKYWAIYTLLLVAALYTHYFSTLAFFAEFIYIIICCRKKIPHIVRKLFFVSLAALVLYLPWIPSLITQVLSVEEGYWIDAFTIETFLRFFSQSLIYYESITQNVPGLILVIITLVAIVVTFFETVGTMGEKTKDRIIFISCLVFIPLIVLFVLSIPPLSPVYVARYLTYSLSLFWVLIAVLIAQAAGTKPIFAKILVFLMAACVLIGHFNVYNENNYPPTFEAIIAEMESIDGDMSVPVIFDDATSAAFDAVYYETEKHHVYIINPMDEWKTARPLSRYKGNYVEDFEEFKTNTEVFWYVAPNYSVAAKIKRGMEKSGFKLDFNKKYDSYTIYKFKKEN